MKRGKGYFSISAVAKMFSVHQQTIRMYEKEGLITPKRSEGNTRLFSQEDVEKLEEIIFLTHKMGVNLAGVEIIMRMQKKMRKMQEEMNKIFDNTSNQLEAEGNSYKQALAQEASKLQSLKHSKALSVEDKKSQKNIDWEIEYDKE